MVALLSDSSSVFYTVDFECFTFDLCRKVGALANPSLRTAALLKSIDFLDELMEHTQQENKKVTFFCTGVIADLYPSIIKMLADKGYEVACHGDYHDDVWDMTPTDLYESLRVAKDKLSNLTGRNVHGFRAPRFSVDKFDFDRLSQIAELFDYDSSLHFRSLGDFESWKLKCPVKMVEFPVPKQKVGFYNFDFKTGGSYLKLFPVKMVFDAIRKSAQAGLTPIIYLHPYDLHFGYDMLASWSELKGAEHRLYWYVRQLQWAGLFNSRQEKKLIKLFNSFQHKGALCDHV